MNLIGDVVKAGTFLFHHAVCGGARVYLVEDWKGEGSSVPDIAVDAREFGLQHEDA